MISKDDTDLKMFRYILFLLKINVWFATTLINNNGCLDRTPVRQIAEYRSPTPQTAAFALRSHYDPIAINFGCQALRECRSPSPIGRINQRERLFDLAECRHLLQRLSQKLANYTAFES
jgi:hypothetical protein